MIVRRYIVCGKVQGVGFRWFVREAARALGISGRVRNELTGEVSVEAAADVAVLTQFEAALWNGPPGSRTDAVDMTTDSSATVDSLPNPFQIDR